MLTAAPPSSHKDGYNEVIPDRNKRAIYVSCIRKSAMVTLFFLAFRCMRNKRLQLGSQTQHWPTMPAQGLAAADRRPIWERPGNCERLSLQKGLYRSEDSDMTLVETRLRIEEAETLFKANAGHQVERWARPGRGGSDYTRFPLVLPLAQRKIPPYIQHTGFQWVWEGGDKLLIDVSEDAGALTLDREW